jgi:hypothetical protein
MYLGKKMVDKSESSWSMVTQKIWMLMASAKCMIQQIARSFSETIQNRVSHVCETFGAHSSHVTNISFTGLKRIRSMSRLLENKL